MTDGDTLDEFAFSRHAREEIHRRNIAESNVVAVLRQPEQVVSGHGGLQVYQSRVQVKGKQFLLRVVVSDAGHPAVVVTVYRTSKIDKYWRSE